MATIREANAINVILEYLLQTPRPGLGVPSDEWAREAAEFLADRANKALYAGLRAEDVRSHWPGRRGATPPDGRP